MLQAKSKFRQSIGTLSGELGRVQGATKVLSALTKSVFVSKKKNKKKTSMPLIMSRLEVHTKRPVICPSVD